MELTTKQEQGLKTALSRYSLGMPYTVISGYAGTGKSTLVNFIVSALNINENDVAYIAYTGKASQVLKSKGCKNAVTAHKLLYYANKNKEGEFIFRPRERLEHPYKLIVIDEVSMLPEKMWYQLLSHGIYVLALGDPGQLPPVKDKPAPILEKPHVFLDEVMRQAQESAIIRLSMHIREGKDFRTFPTVSGEVGIIPHKYMFDGEDVALLQADQIICGTNAERNRINKKVRELMGRGPEPEIGDKIIGLDNHWDDISVEGNALTNGAIGTINKYEMKEQFYPASNIKFKDFPESSQIMYTDFDTEDGDAFLDIPIDYHCITTGDPLLTPKQEGTISSYNRGVTAKSLRTGDYGMMNYLKTIPYHFNYGYAITCWKAQGSEFPLVIGYDASWLKKKSAEEYQKYLYTLVTRTQKTLILVGE